VLVSDRVAELDPEAAERADAVKVLEAEAVCVLDADAVEVRVDVAVFVAEAHSTEVQPARAAHQRCLSQC